MLYMKEMRAKVVAECTLKESAAINQILGRRVSPHGLPGTRQHCDGRRSASLSTAGPFPANFYSERDLHLEL